MPYLLIVVIGLLGGIVSGLFGVGGGIVFVPLLILLRNFDPHVAIGTSLAAIIPTAMAGLLKNTRAEMVDWRTAAIIALFAMAGAWIGASLSLSLDAAVLRRLYAVFLAFLALKLFFLN